jgi:hypothetical protein
VDTLALQISSRVSDTLSYPGDKHQPLKIGYSRGDYLRFGGNYYNVSLAWQYS